MRSLYVRILVALVGTVLISLVAFLATFLAMTRPAEERLLRQFQTRQIEDAVSAYELGGPAQLSIYLDRLDRAWDAKHYFVDADDRDLVTGGDRSAIAGAPRSLFGGPPVLDGRLLIVQRSPDSRYRLLIVAPPPFNVRAFLPYYVLILAAVALVCWLLAVTIVRPIRQLAAVVERFGRSDLATRARIDRRDEIGNLAGAFNRMADRIETLVTAERRLLQDISHELRSPLARLKIGIELARTALDRESATDRLQKEVDRLTALVGGLIEVTRAEGDPSTRKSELVLLNEVVAEVVQRCSLEAEAKQSRIVVAGTAAGTVRGDPELLRRAVENVLRNAIRHAPAPSEIDVRIDSDDGATHICVRDRGHGVPEALLPRLAEPFFRADDSRDATTGGVGLGLAIARRALLLHHGTLVAENANPGLRVTLTIPTAPAF
ncbi:MAG: ATP-binding protein [Acidobacteriota bacterium]